jgi:hypothetical protein
MIPSLSVHDRIALLGAVSKSLLNKTDELDTMIQTAYARNSWFTPDNIATMLQGVALEYLDEGKLTEWAKQYTIAARPFLKVGLVLAGNIPAVGFNDILCVFIAGHQAHIKYSEKDDVIIPYIIDQIVKLDARAADYFVKVDFLKNIDAVIATGSDNSARYFNEYFSNYPHIIRKNRNSVAVLDGTESREELYNLGKDVFTYFGLGCRNVSKLYVPKDYDFIPWMEESHKYNDLANHNKYKNNFDYNVALMLLNRVKFINNGCSIVLEDPRFSSRIASIHFEYYDDDEILVAHLQENIEKIQCVIGHKKYDFVPCFDFGMAQCPSLYDYADGVDTLAFLSTL